jgi:ribosome-binding factor A
VQWKNLWIEFITLFLITTQ